MSERVKRLLLITGFLLSVVAIATLLYVAFFRTPSAPPLPVSETQPTTTPTGGLAPSAEGTPGIVTTPGVILGLEGASPIALGGVTQTTELTTAPVKNLVLSGDGTSVNFYDETDGKFYTIDAEGNIHSLSDKTFPSVEDAIWNNDASKAILEFPDGSNVVYDFDDETQVTLPKHWEDFDFSPTSDELIAKSIGLDPNNRWLVLSSSTGSNVKTIQALGDNEAKVQVNWSPNNQVIAFSDTAGGIGSFDRKTIIPLGKNKENFKGLTVEGLGFHSTWSPDGKQLLYSVSGAYSNYRPLLWVVNASSATMGEERKSIPLNTWIDKCTFADSATAYCAVPQNLPPNAGLQRVLYGSYPDSLYKVDMQTGTTQLIAIPSENKTMSNLFVTKNQDLLYYSNSATGNLEYIKLK